MQKYIIWQAIAWPAIEVFSLQSKPEVLEARGAITGRSDAKTPFALTYRVIMDHDWSVRRLFIHSLLNDQKLELTHTGNKWFSDGLRLPEFDNIEFIDISLSPFTNSLPIRRIAFQDNKRQPIDVIYISLPDFRLRKVQQYYSRLSETTFRYEDLEIADFVADIIVDETKLVVEYPGLFSRA